MWHKIEETMPKGQKALESLRDDVMERRKRPTDSETLTLQPKQKAKRAPIPSGVVSLVRTTQHHGNGKFLEGGTDVLDSGSDNEFFE